VGQRWGAAAGISVSAVVFSLAHLSLSEALPLLGLGVGLGLVRWRSGRLFSCAAMHGLWNGLTFTNLLLLGS
jgi:membrane protease YdiL (CAAX protease family)